MKHTCLCGNEFDGRADAKFCSSTCRSKFSRELKLVELEPPTVSPAEAEKVESPAYHVCSEDCVYYVEVDGAQKQRYSKEHWQSLMGPVTAEDLKHGWTPHIYPQPQQRDCRPGVLQPDGTRKIVKIE